MQILFLEDRGSVTYYLAEGLRAAGHTVFEANDINDAQSYWEDETIDCIIADLNMNPVGLKPDEVPETHNGVLTGWVWLDRHVYNKHPEMKERTIIYTEYREQLAAFVPPDKWKKIRTVDKRGDSPTDQINSCVSAIANSL